ncbi:hypothetical protein DICVIV_07564 [Dictyocaulus viviparus]|uniref:DUF7087 domain-containing protein n=1 Tax=Dictyocaulus viviparus TaxID=29172 RepID=A0A0D8XVL6_DICVI|nr:hypothetical protein DICVIV_07564 [Dictyocaulus viviparus]
MCRFFDNYDFPYIVGMSRGIQFHCCIFQLLMIYSESGNISVFNFIYYNILCNMYTIHIFRRWYYNLDGRFDMHQLIREPENTVKIQYSIALFTPIVLSVLIFITVKLHTNFIRFLFTLTCIAEMSLALGILILEAFEIFVKETNSPPK